MRSRETFSPSPRDVYEATQAQKAKKASAPPEGYIDYFKHASAEDYIETPIVAPVETDVDRTPVSEAEVHEALEKLKSHFVAEDTEDPAPLIEGGNPADISTPSYTHSFELGATAIHLDEVETEPQNIEVHVHDEVEAPAKEVTVEEEPVNVETPVAETVVEAPVKEEVVAEVPVIQVPITLATEPAVVVETPKAPEEESDVIPDEVIAEVASTMKRADFVKQQEDLFGANDKIAPEDVPEGEMTYEQYLAQRPVAEAGDFYHHNGRVYNAAPGGPTKNKKALYEEKLNNSSADEHYQKLEAQSNMDAVYDEAVAENEKKNISYDDVIRSNTEGEFLVQKDPMLKGLLKVGEELLALYNSDLTGEEFEQKIRPELEEKQAFYDGLFKMYIENGVDRRALGYIDDKTSARVEDPEFIPVEGSGYVDGEKVDILDFTETPDGKKAYTIEKDDGSIEAVYTDNVEFRREFETQEAPEEVIPEEEKLSRFDRVKKWFGKERRKYQEFGGKAYWGGVFSTPGNWLDTRRMEAGMSMAEIQEQKEKNRTRAVLGLAALAAIRVTAQYAGLDHGGGSDFMASIFNGKPDVDTTPSANTYPSISAIEHAAGQGQEEKLELFIPGNDQIAQPEAPVVNIDNPIYNIPDGGNLSDVVHSLGMTDAQLAQHAPELMNLFPGTFYLGETGDLRINDDGWLPAGARQKFEEYKNAI